MSTIDTIKSRRSIRKYQSKPIPRETLIDIVDCARLAPTGMNEQPWEFVVITSPDTRRGIAELITHATFINEVPACIAVLCRPTRFCVEDGSAATMNILLAAKAHGLGSCWISGDKQPYADAVARLVGSSGQLKLFSLVTLGYPAENPIVDKRSLESVLHWEKL